MYSYFSIGSSPSTYVFNGTVTVSNLNEILYSAVLIQGVDPRDYTISYIRGNSPADGFLNPDQIELLTNVRILEDNMSFLLPLTNYLSGQDITYSMFLEEDIPGCLTTIILPPKYTLEATSNLPDISFYPYLASILGQDNQFLIAVPGTSASAYVYTIYNTRTTLISTLRCQDSSKTASLAAGAAFSYTFIIIECYSEDSNTGFYNVDWDLYSIQNGITVTYLKT